MASIARIPIQVNANYKRNGLKSYVYLLNKYGISPTVRGPYMKSKQLLVKQSADGTQDNVYVWTNPFS